jgi:hypothetical protein
MIPRIAIVGHPNKGKSSIVATLAEDDSVAISPLPGTTTQARRFPMRIDDELLYELFDTPGFQRPRETLAWLTEHHPSAHERAQTVADFVAAHRQDDRFHDECELLGPVLDGAGILYVVDGSKPYGAEYEAEMQVLQWTGQPRMALINLIGEGDYVDAWRRALDQFFSIARVFDATRADFSRRVALLQGFGELSEEWRPAMDRAVAALTTERTHRQRQSAVEIADLVIAVATGRVSKVLSADEDIDAPRQNLTQRLHERVRRRETQAREVVQAIYQHASVALEEQAASLLGVDLFSEQAWQIFGLSRGQLATTGALSGAVAGGGVDAALGGATLLLGAGIGALLGGIGAFVGTPKLARSKLIGLPVGGRELTVGPIRDPNIGWIILTRALLHHRLVAERNHARREALIIDAGEENHLSEQISAADRRAVDRLVTAIGERGGAEVSERRSLENVIGTLLEPGNEPAKVHGTAHE